jgi:hypothetical protein
MRKISFSVLLTAVIFVSGCYTKAYLQETAKYRQIQQNQQSSQSLQSSSNQAANQPNK